MEVIKMANVKLTRENGAIKVSSPYDARFVAKVKEIGGKWDGTARTWNVTDEVEEQLKGLLTSFYGYTENSSDLIKIKYNASDFEEDDSIQIDTIKTVTRGSRDGGVSFHSNTIVLSGGFPSGGGSAKYPRPNPDADTELQSIIPRTVYDKLSDEDKIKIEIVAEKSQKEKLDAEKEMLLKRLAKIEEELKNL